MTPRRRYSILGTKSANWLASVSPGGHFVAHDHRHGPDALEETRQILQAGIAPALFEPAFVHRGVLVRVDIIEKLPAGGWRLIEVKSTTRLKDILYPRPRPTALGPSLVTTISYIVPNRLCWDSSEANM